MRALLLLALQLRLGATREYTNPVLAATCATGSPPSTWPGSGCEQPDPGLARPVVGGRWVALTTTQDSNRTFARHSSDDLASWRDEGSVWDSRTRPAWGIGSWFAPELHQHGGRWILVFSALSKETGKQAIGAAFAATAAGPFVDSGGPIAVEHTNTNDPTLADADGALWLGKREVFLESWRALS